MTRKRPTRSASPRLPLDDATRETIRLKAHRVARRAGLPPTDVPDIAQDISLHVWSRLGRFDPDRAVGQAAFVRMLVAHATAAVLRGRVRTRRRAPAPLGAILVDPADRRAAREQERAVLAIDVGAVLATLPPRLRRLAESLKKRSVAATARRLGLSRAEVYRRLAWMRDAFVAAGLGEKPCPVPDTSGASGVVPR